MTTFAFSCSYRCECMCKFSAKACHVSLHYFIFYFLQYLLGNLLLIDVLASVNGRRKGSLKIGNTEKTQPSRIKNL